MNFIFVLSIVSVLVCWAAEVDYAPTSYYDANKNSISGTPPGSNPSFLYSSPSFNAYEREELHQHCIDRLNMYRSGALKFSDNSDDTNVLGGLSPFKPAADYYKCVSSEAMGDLYINQNGGGGCAGAHDTAFSCGMGGSQGQNSCCGRGGGSFGSSKTIFTLADVKTELNGCLQQMWDEGITPGQKGHWETMRSTTYTRAACGFAWTSAGRIMMIQDFTNRDGCSTSACGECGTPACARCSTESCGNTGAPTASPPTGSPTPSPPTVPPTPAPTSPPVAGTAAPTPAPTPALPAGGTMPSDAEIRGECLGWGYTNHVQTCDGMCWQPYDLIKNYIGNGNCGDLSGYGIDMNCIRLKCEGGDCSSCSQALGGEENKTTTWSRLPLTPPPRIDADSSFHALPAWSLLLLSVFLLNMN